MKNPEERYSNLTKKIRMDGKPVYAPSIPKTVPTNDNDLTMEVSEADRMDIIAFNHFGSATDWWKIAAANKLVNGSIYFNPGETVVIPKV